VCVEVHCSVLQCVTVRFIVYRTGGCPGRKEVQCVTVCFSVYCTGGCPGRKEVGVDTNANVMQPNLKDTAREL